MSLEDEMRLLVRNEGVAEALLLFAHTMDKRLRAIEEKLERVLARRYEAPPQ